MRYNIKKLQNNYTTPEQSKRLLELGVPADSADCIFTRFSRDEKWKRRFIEDIVSAQLFCNQDFYLPCWSVGRLIEIYMIAARLQWIDLCLPNDFTESIVKMFVGTKDLDFSYERLEHLKLED